MNLAYLETGHKNPSQNVECAYKDSCCAVEKRKIPKLKEVAKGVTSLPAVFTFDSKVFS